MDELRGFKRLAPLSIALWRGIYRVAIFLRLRRTQVLAARRILDIKDWAFGAPAEANE